MLLLLLFCVRVSFNVLLVVSWRGVEWFCSGKFEWRCSCSIWAVDVCRGGGALIGVKRQIMHFTATNITGILTG